MRLSKEQVYYNILVMNKKVFKGIIALFAVVFLCTACGSNSNSKCAVCGKTLTQETGRVKATVATGKKVTVCNSCYAIGRQAGKTL